MRLSPDNQELAESKFNRRAEQIIREANRPVIINGRPRGMDSRSYPIKKLKGLASAWLEIWLEAFRLESLVPDENDVEELNTILRRMIKNHSAGMMPGFIVGAETPASIAENTYEDLIERVKEMRIKNRTQPDTLQPQTITTYNRTIHGDNYGNIQKGGEGNTQIIHRSDDET